MIAEVNLWEFHLGSFLLLVHQCEKLIELVYSMLVDDFRILDKISYCNSICYLGNNIVADVAEKGVADVAEQDVDENDDVADDGVQKMNRRASLRENLAIGHDLSS